MDNMRTLAEIDDDLVMAVFDGNETRIARLQQERERIARNTKSRIDDLGVFGD